MDLVATVLRLAASRRSVFPDPAELIGLGDAWRKAERAVVVEAMGAPDRAAALAAAFERLAEASGERGPRGRAARLHGSLAAHRGDAAASIPCYRTAAKLLTGTARDSEQWPRKALAPGSMSSLPRH